MAPAIPRIGTLPSGHRDAITDVAGVTVGHCTLDEGDVQTGVTVVCPHAGDPYLQRVPAGVAVLNGFGKSVGLVQVEELGVLETPIALTNTFSVPAVAEAQIRDCIAMNPECGRRLPSVNPLVFECNDGFLNDMQHMAVRGHHYLQAKAAAGAEVPQGSVGAGRGMSSFALKGGIGTASRRVSAPGAGLYTVGALVLANHGLLPNLVIAGRAVGGRLGTQLATKLASAVPAAEPEKGSIIMLIATDAPLDARQLRRLALRAGAGLARTGSVFGHGSGDIALAFSTAYTLPQRREQPMPAVALLHDALLDGLFQATADGVEQAILHALWQAEPITGRDGHVRPALDELLRDWPSDAFAPPDGPHDPHDPRS
ncbi:MULTISPECIES: P1 family peptidase [unclassified Variovorax]|uniref:DmpA family aminopeptidase n=1 Tax=unclassified Variovorax TaxID=663243 RepID=UPI00076CFB2B|nr:MULTISPECIES: P1 family peptidase [unclassified Variovorax]KWT75023.1 macromolecule metabolism [Variovorax sp. WDL1]PNG53111.1 Beta-peptidyl aminopeptidase BapA [Variovorax sp. B2]PNG53683.1 Beta-peptidyl aminopeptidase BapA [Variovorax sp. B4]VTV11126.1 L-aminopeptidase/D-esterase [Variovorax sp. WDL1]